MNKREHITREGLLELLEAERQANANLRQQALMADELLGVARAEVARLRTALEQVAHYAPPDDHISNYEMMVAGAQLIELGKMARAALKGETK